MITYAVGDLHGRFDLLQEAWIVVHQHLLHTPEKKKKAQFVVLGDFIDRGPESAKIIDWLRCMTDNVPEDIAVKVRVIRGNHEDMMIEVLWSSYQPNIQKDSSCTYFLTTIEILKT